MNDAFLAMLQQALGHELPNQLVAIQGLARLLEMDQAKRLDDDGKDHLRRLAAAARKAHEQLRDLADQVRAERSKVLSPSPAAGYHGPQQLREP